MKIEFLVDHINYSETIASWFIKEWGERYPERSLHDWAETQTYLNKKKLPLTLVAIENNEVVGTVCLRSDGMATHGEWRAWLSYLVVPESHRGKGIAKELVKKTEIVAKELGIDELHLFTRLENPKLYSDLDWKIVGREKYRGGTVSIMKKILTPTPVLAQSNTSKSLFGFFKNPLCIVSAAFVTGLAYVCARNMNPNN